MGVLAECPVCHKRQSIKNKLCSCGKNLDKAKEGKRIKYWVDYRLKDKTHIRECLTKYSDVDPYSFEDSKDVLSKRRVQKREKKLFDVRVEEEMTFKELSDWYLGLKKVKALDSYYQITNNLAKFNLEFGNRLVCEIKPTELEDYRIKRRGEGRAGPTQLLTKKLGLPKLWLIWLLMMIK